VLLAGRPIRGGLIGAAPSLSELEDGDLKAQADFRQVYATILEEWLGVAAKDVLDSSFETLPIFRA
jgi:uncharacterized protein (DUF1501 family)